MNVPRLPPLSKPGEPPFLVGAVLFGLIVLGGCGYRLGSPRSELVGDGLRLAVPVFENETMSLVAPVALTEAVKEAVARYPALRLTEEPGADRLEGTVTKVSTQARVVGQGREGSTEPEPLRSETCVSVGLRLVRDGLEHWSWNGTECEGSFNDLYGSQTDANRERALRVASQRLAERALRDMAEGF